MKSDGKLSLIVFVWNCEFYLCIYLLIYEFYWLFCMSLLSIFSSQLWIQQMIVFCVSEHTFSIWVALLDSILWNKWLAACLWTDIGRLDLSSPYLDGGTDTCAGVDSLILPRFLPLLLSSVSVGRGAASPSQQAPTPWPRSHWHQGTGGGVLGEWGSGCSLL